MDSKEITLSATLAVLDNLLSNHQLEFVHPEHHLNSRYFLVSKEEKSYRFETTSTIIPGLQNHKELEFKIDEEYELRSENESLYFRGKDIFFTEISYSEDRLKILSGNIRAFSTVKLKDKQEKLHRRFIMPLKDEKLKFNDFQGRGLIIKYGNPVKSHGSSHIPITINGNLFLLYQTKFKESNYVFIESSETIWEIEFQKICFNILLSMAFVKGNLYHDDAFIFGYSKKEMEVPDEVSYNSMNGTVITNQPTFTTSIYSIYKDQLDSINDEKEEEIMKKKLFEGIFNFSIKSFSNLAELITNEEGIQRAIILYINGHISALEIRLPNYFVAIEALTNFISNVKKDEKKRLNPIKDNKVAKDVEKLIVSTLEKYAIDNNLDKENFDTDILKRKLESLNSPPNADKLSESFSLVNYELTLEERKLMKERNTFLHGRFIKYLDDDREFSEALYICLKIHFLFAVLVLKSVDFEGKIINYVAVWDKITNKPTSEERLRMI